MLEEMLIRFGPGCICKGWTVVELLREDDLGGVYKVSKENVPYILKIQNTNRDYSVLNNEIRALQELQKFSLPHICKLEEAGNFDNFRYAVFTGTGKTLDDLRRQNRMNKFSLGTAISVAIKCLEVIEELHDVGFLGRDIQPANFAIGEPEMDELDKIYLLEAHMTRDFTKDNGINGRVFWSIDYDFHLSYTPLSYHQHSDVICIDDIESWFYMIVEWTCGKLPWKYIKDEDHIEIFEMKKQVREYTDKFMDGCPREYFEIFKIIVSNYKKHIDKAVYENIYRLLREASKNVKLSPLDWETEKIPKEVKQNEPEALNVQVSPRDLRTTNKTTKEVKKIEKARTVKHVASLDWKIEESNMTRTEFMAGTCQRYPEKKIGKKFKYRVDIYQRGIPKTEYRYGSWVILNLYNYTYDTNIEAKYTVSIPSANYMEKCHHIYQKTGEWEMFGCKIPELFNPEKKYFVNGKLCVKFEFEFAEFEREEEEDSDVEVDNLQISALPKIPEELVWSFTNLFPISIEVLKAYEKKLNECINSDVCFCGDEFKYYYQLIPNSYIRDIENGTWFFLYLKNLKKETFIQAKFNVCIMSGKYVKKECRHFFKKFNEWERVGIKLDEIFDPKKTRLDGRKKNTITLEIDFNFAKDLKEVENKNDETEAAVSEFENLSVFPAAPSEVNDRVLPSRAITVENVYFPPTDSWLKSNCELIGIQFYKNLSKFRPPIDDIQKFKILKPDDVITVKGDGRCGYRSLSVLLCGKESYHIYVGRVIWSLIVEKSNPKFEEMYIFKNAKANAQRKLESDAPASEDERYWMDDVDLATAAKLFDCNIYVFTANQEWQCYGPKTFENGIMDSFENFDPKIPTLLLQNSGGNHFSPVINVRLK